MNHPIVHRLAFSLIVANLLAPLALRAEIRSKSKELVFMEPRDSRRSVRAIPSFCIRMMQVALTSISNRVAVVACPSSMFPTQAKLSSSPPLR